MATTFEGVLRASFARATKTFRAGVLLTEAGFGPQAGMMVRALFEDVVVSYWMVYVQSEDWVVSRMVDRRRYGQLLHRDVVLKHFSGSGIDPDEAIGASQLAALQADGPRLSALFGRHGEAFWWANEARQIEKRGAPPTWKPVRPSRNLNTLVEALEHAGVERAANGQTGRDHVVQPPLPDGHTALRGYMGIAHSFNNMLMHHSEFALQVHATGATGGDQRTWNEAPSAQWVPQIELCLFWTFGQMLLLMCDRLRPDLTPETGDLFDGALKEAWPVQEPAS